MKITVCKDYDQLSDHAARLVLGVVKQSPEAALCLASGHTPIGAFRKIVALARSGEADFTRCHFIGLDEWAGISSSQEGSCRFFLDEFLFRPLAISENQIYFFDGLAKDLDAECRKMDEKIAGLGGLDLMLVGIGMNGHIALNEPGTPWHYYSHVAELDTTTKSVGQKYFAEKTELKKGITLGLQHLREARLAVLMASGQAKAEIVREAMKGRATEALPGSIFQTLPDALVLLDREAASALSPSVQEARE